MKTNSPMALVLGITGGIGGELARTLLARGWRVRALHRRPEEAAAAAGLGNEVEWIKGDAMCRADVVQAAAGAAVIVHGVNPPKYHNWAGLALPMLENTIAAARAASARVLFPGTIYNFGPDAFPRVTEESAQNPLTRKGRIRVRMEERLREAAREGARVLIVRAGDYFGPRAGNTWFSQGLLAGQQKVRRVFYPGPRDLGHAWAYLPDLAEAMARLLDRDADLADFEVFNSAACGCPGVPTWPRPSVAQPGFPRAGSTHSRGGACGSQRRSSRYVARCWRCAICGILPSSWTTPGCVHASARSRTRPWKRRWRAPTRGPRGTLRRRQRNRTG